MGHQHRFNRSRGFVLLLIIAVLLFVAGAVAYVMSSFVPKLPSLDVITQYQPKIPLRVYTADKVLIGEFGEERRDFIPIAQIPEKMKKALLAIEDSRFYEHNGVDWIRAGGAIKGMITSGRITGFSTITMQIPRNFVISRAKVPSRKLAEIMLAYRLEEQLTKDQILEVYMNHMFLGQRAYGFGSAARIYFNKPLAKLSLAEMAMLAGLPQNPSYHNPIANPKRARHRQHQVLARMRELNYIDEDEYRKALAEPLKVNPRGGQEFATHAEYVAELARQQVYAQFKEEAYTRGFVVTTTIRSADQNAAYAAVRRNVTEFDQRRGYRGPEARIDLPEPGPDRDDAIDEALQQRPASDGFMPAVVLEASRKRVVAETMAGDTLELEGDALKFAARALSPEASSSLRIEPGAVIRVSRDAKKRWAIAQVPQVAAAFVSLDPDTGAYRALVGGFDYNLQKYNHVTQAWRQPGSAFKPFVYSAALEQGFWPGTLILDEPLDMPGEDAGETWSPRNDDGEFEGQVTLRRALARSKNVPTVRLMRAVGVQHVHEHMARFGFDPARHPRNLTMALGTGAVTPLQMAGAYSVIANGGYKVQPYLVSKITDGAGNTIFQAKPPEKTRVLDSRNAFIMDSILRDVTVYGTAAAASPGLGRRDLAGKTGTTTDAVDGWFAGYGGGVVAVAWMGYDEPRTLGSKEFGSTLALPIWMDYMKRALSGVPPRVLPQPEGLVQEGDEWMYAEHANGAAIRLLDVAPLPETPAPEEEAEQPEEVIEEPVTQ
ncbi:MAG TPA: PBP1A family penicillin-binding protein [Telluria sp.]|nr:PBP1A family penicillin-binding protein [Telluria sp.]